MPKTLLGLAVLLGLLTLSTAVSAQTPPYAVPTDNGSAFCGYLTRSFSNLRRNAQVSLAYAGAPEENLAAAMDAVTMRYLVTLLEIHGLRRQAKRFQASQRWYDARMDDCRFKPDYKGENYPSTTEELSLVALCLVAHGRWQLASSSERMALKMFPHASAAREEKEVSFFQKVADAQAEALAHRERFCQGVYEREDEYEEEIVFVSPPPKPPMTKKRPPT